MRTFDAKELSLKIDHGQLKPLFKIYSNKHASDMVLDWLIIFTTIFLCIQFFNPAFYLLAVIIIGARMHALAILMHDAAHFRFLKNRKWNDILTNYLTMYPIFTSIEKYRLNHLRHHNHLNTHDDPDWVAKLGKRAFTFPKTKREFLFTVASYLVLYQGISDALWFLKRFGGKKEKSESKRNYGQLLFYIILFTVLTVFGIWKYFLLFWVVPYLSTFFMFQYIRSVAEHFGDLSYDDLLTSTRSVRPTLIERFFVAPHNVSYHLEHHLYPGVPYYNLEKLHFLLMEEASYSEKAHITQGYTVGLLDELSRYGDAVNIQNANKVKSSN